MLLFLLGKSIASNGQTSALSSGQWSKFSVGSDGVYKIDYTLFKKTGIDPDKIDPRNIKILASGNGMLPQSNSAMRQGELIELSIFVSGESDGRFGRDDFILFFAQGPDDFSYNIVKEMFDYNNHLYSDKNFYFITVASSAGKRISAVESANSGFPIISEFEDFGFHETNQYNELKSGREWFGEQFDANTDQTIKFEIPGITQGSEIKVASNVMAKSFVGSSFKLFLNGASLGEQFIAQIPNTTYGIKGRHSIDTFKTNSTISFASTRSSQEIRFQYVKGVSGPSIGYINHFQISFKRKLALYQNQTIFSAAKSLENVSSTFEVESIKPEVSIWEITDPFKTTDLKFTVAGSKAIFSIPTETLKRFIVFDKGEIPPPVFESLVANQNLRSIIPTDLIIVVHPDFLDQATRLSEHRINFNNLSVRVVTTEEVYNDYSGGKQDVTAIRDFARSAYLQGGLKNLLLFGRCSYDYKNKIANNTNFVPTYESYNSLSPLETYSSDDYFTFFDDNEGDWRESPAQNHTMEIGVGRLSVKTIKEATDVVDKLIEYDLGKKIFGKWRKEILFVADDGDFNIHQGQADQLATQIEVNHPEINTQKVYLDSYEQISRPSGQISPEASNALKQALKRGVLITNFTGHGSEQVWLQERILDETFVTNWENYTSYPLLVTATCEFGRHDDPGQISSGELTQIKKNGGSIGLVTTARPVNSSSNFTLNKAFYESFFQKIGGRYKDLGTIFRDTKNKSLSGVANRNFSLLGDPSMKLAIPDDEVIISRIKTETNSDTLKALSKVQIIGEVQTNGVKNSNFNGTLLATLFDKETLLETKGDENPPFSYSLWNNALFRGEASVTGGTFQMEFILPKNIAYQIGSGKLSTYAQDKAHKFDASGGTVSFKIGESEKTAIEDTTPPSIKLFLGDTTFIAGGIINANSQLVAQLFDESGINISSYGIGNTMVAIIDDNMTYEVNEYFTAAENSYKKGTLVFPLEELEIGKHSITLKVWDNLNNPAIASVNFVVSESAGLEVQELSNYPNPFTESTTIQFIHSRPGEDLEVALAIYTTTGQTVQTMNFSLPESQYQVSLLDWDGSDAGGRKLTPGIYLMKVLVRSLQDGSKNEQIAKLIILN
ncbi:MAG: type IX secretion system sortase PorU [Bacteroidia bacterium]|nr:type IX secretion system sortase PorU [Bacteroidia bacterium]